eukprot:scaffold53329_cov63-Attheya_sp.AAC.3
MVMGSFMDEYNVFENNTRLEHPMEIGKENIVYSLDPTVYWEQNIVQLFFYLLTKYFDPETGLIHDGFNIAQIKAGSYTMTEGWEKMTKILQWVFQPGGIGGKDSRNGHWSLIVYHRPKIRGRVQYIDPKQRPLHDVENIGIGVVFWQKTSKVSIYS